MRRWCALVWSRPVISGASSLDNALEITSVNLSCSGDIASSSAAIDCIRLLPLVESIESESFVVSRAIASPSLVLLAQGLPVGKTYSAVWNVEVVSPKGAFADKNVVVISVVAST